MYTVKCKIMMGVNFDDYDSFQLHIHILTRQTFLSITVFTGAW